MGTVVPTPLTPTYSGGQAFLALWVLLTTNPAFLLTPAATSVNTDIAANKPLGTTPIVLTPDSNDKITDWADLIAALAAKLPFPPPPFTNPNAGQFTKPELVKFLTQTLATTTLDYGDGSTGPTYAAVLSSAAAVFQALARNYDSAWSTHVCPPTMSETFGM
jgi:hypothetical protein